MSYPGGFSPATGYGYGYSPSDSYQYNEQQQPYPSNPRLLPTWDGSYHGRNTQRPQQMFPMQQVQIPLHGQTAYYPIQQQNQFYTQAQAQAVPDPNHYAPVPQSDPQYPQFITHQQQQYHEFELPVSPSYQTPSLPQAQVPSSPPRLVPPQLQPPKSSLSVKIPAFRNSDQIRLPSKSQSKSKSKRSPIESSPLLISLAEEYMATAHKLSASAFQMMDDEQVIEYQCLVATALGCLKTSFSRSRLAPRLEARVRLRYANILVEETENYEEAETALSQGVILCEQNRYLDLKYNMQFLLARVVFANNPKAALKALERLCADTEAYRHRPWEYVFRFLRASLSSTSLKMSDTLTAINDLRYVSSLATKSGDRAIYLLASLMEGLIHLSSSNPESSEQAQTALAAAWTYQLDVECRIPQLVMLTHILDVACSMLYSLPAQREYKQKAMEEAYKSSQWSRSSDTTDDIAIPIKTSENQTKLVSQDTSEVLGISDDGKHTLMMSFLNSNDTFALIYLLSGIALMHNNCSDGKSVQYLKQALRSLRDSNKSRRQEGPSASMTKKLQWRRVLSCYVLIYSAFCLASSYDWKAARDCISQLGENLKEVDDGSTSLLAQFQVYLSGICFQGTGDLHNALRMYKDPKLRLSDRPGSNSGPEEQVQHELSLLAGLNALWIQKVDPEISAAQNTATFEKLEPLCTNHLNKDLETAFKLVRATVPTDPPTSGVKNKNYLGASLDAASRTCNKQFLCIALGLMCSRFFVGVVGLQAEKAARASVHQAKRARNTLWMSVTFSMMAQNFGIQGKPEEAQEAQEEAIRLAASAFPRLT